MKTIGKIFVLFFTLSIVLTACGSDDDKYTPPDYTLYDNSVLIGDYMGKCTAKIIDKIKEDVVTDTKVNLIKTDDKNTLMLGTSEFGIMIRGGKLTNFKNTPDGTGYTFDMGEILMEGLVGGQIPTLIYNWFKVDYTLIDKVDIKLNATSALYTKASDNLEFTYTGSVKIYATTDKDGEISERTDEYKISYKYLVKKQ